jgi:hypothetical protein
MMVGGDTILKTIIIILVKKLSLVIYVLIFMDCKLIINGRIPKKLLSLKRIMFILIRPRISLLKV